MAWGHDGEGKVRESGEGILGFKRRGSGRGLRALTLGIKRRNGAVKEVRSWAWSALRKTMEAT